MTRIFQVTTVALLAAATAIPAGGQGQPAPKYSAKVPPYITTPDTVETRIGTLKFFDGLPDPETVQKVYDNLDFVRGVEAFLSGMPAASLYAACEGLSQAGATRNGGIAITEDLMDARSLFLTPNSTTVYVMMCIDLKDGPVVAEVPPGVLGPVDDAYFRYVTDVGLTGPDQGKGGKYLFVPPGYTGDVPSEGYFVAKPSTYGNLLFYRAFVKDGDIAAAVNGVKAKGRVYPLSAAGKPPSAFVGGSYAFLNDGERMLDARTLFHYYATGITPAMANSKPGTGSAYAYSARDSMGRYLDGGKTYKITLPAPIPVGQFWSFMVYDGQTRSMLETDQKLAGLDSNQKDIKKNADGSVTVWFVTKAPAGQEANWVQTMPGKGWNSLLRLYAPLEPWFDKSWKPGDFELVE